MKEERLPQLANFLVVGAQKAGTTALYHYLAGHPQVYVAPQKETKFFVDDRKYGRGIGFYRREYFGGWQGETAVGEIDPDYLYFEEAPQRIAQDLGQPRLIFIFRNPVDRAFSHYLMSRRRGLEPLSFEEALDREEERIQGGFLDKVHFSYGGRGMYARQLERFLQYFRSDHMLFLLSEDLAEDTAVAVQTCFRFLGVDDGYQPGEIGRRYHQATVPRSARLQWLLRRPAAVGHAARIFVPNRAWRQQIRRWGMEWNQKRADNIQMGEDTRQRLRERFAPENRKLAGMIGRDLSGWE